MSGGAHPAQAFVYVPKGAETPTEDYPNQRYFPVEGESEFGYSVKASQGKKVICTATVYRDGSLDLGKLSIRINGYGELAGKFTAAELRQIARQCLDCAYDIETFPAASLAGIGAA